LDYSKRSTAEQTLVHPYLSYYHDPTDEPAFQGSVASSKFLEVYSGSELEISRWKGSTESFELYFLNYLYSVVVGMLYMLHYTVAERIVCDCTENCNKTVTVSFEE